jgi:branched-chain amino acid transport system permease protein
MEHAAQFLLSGIILGGTYGLMSVGLALIFGVMRVVNFGQADFMMVAMYGAFVIWNVFDLEPPLSLVLIGPAFFCLGWLFHRTLLTEVTGSRYRHDAQIVLTLGAGLVLQAGALIVFGANPRFLQASYSGTGWELFGLFVDASRGYAFIVAAAISVLLFALLRFTQLGRAIRAASDDWEASEYMGINVRSIYGISFGLGIALTAMAGTMITTFRPFEPFIGPQFVVLMFVAVVLGGMGSIMGALAGGILVGVTEVMSQLFLSPVLAPVTVFIVFLAILYVRPQGLFGKRVRSI